MNTLAPQLELEPTTCAEPTPHGIMIIYEDRTTGFQAKRFSDMLAASLGVSGQRPACWRAELMDLPGIAAEMSADAARSEFVILSLRGDRGLSVEMKEWIEGWLASAAGGPASLIALFDRDRSAAAYAESVRCFLRQVASESGIPFFAHCAVAPTNAADEFFEDEDECEAAAVSQEIRTATESVLAPIDQLPIHHHPTCVAA